MSTSVFRLTLRAALLAVAIPTTASAADVIWVPEDQPTIQEAVRAARPFDIILIEGGIYFPAVNGMKIRKGVTLVTDIGGSVITGSLTVESVPEGQVVVLDGISTAGGLTVRNNDGVVRSTYHGTWLLSDPLFLFGHPVGVVPAEGTLSFRWVVPELGPGVDGVDVHWQAAFDDGSSVLIGPASVSTQLDGSL